MRNGSFLAIVHLKGNGQRVIVERTRTAQSWFEPDTRGIDRLFDAMCQAYPARRFRLVEFNPRFAERTVRVS